MLVLPAQGFAAPTNCVQLLLWFYGIETCSYVFVNNITAVINQMLLPLK